MSKEAEFSFTSSFITPCSIFDILSLFRCLVSPHFPTPRMEDTVIREVFGIEIRISGALVSWAGVGGKQIA